MNLSLEELQNFSEQLAAREAAITAREAEVESTAARLEREIELRLAAARQEWEAVAEISRHEARGRQEDGPNSELWHPLSRRENLAIESSKRHSTKRWEEASDGLSTLLSKLIV